MFHRILSIPISIGEKDDIRIWYENNEGTFKVKDAYRVALAMDDTASCSNGFDPKWKKMWLSAIPPKEKIFLWRALWDIIPHLGNLQKKRVVELARCPRCGDYESTMHGFRDCSWVRKFWSLVPIALFNMEAPTILVWFTDILSNSNIADLFSCLLWEIWFARNELCFEKIYSSPEIYIKRGKDGMMECQRWNSLATTKAPREKGRWRKAVQGSIKINFDTTINNQRKCYGLDIIARDDQGLVLLSASKT